MGRSRVWHRVAPQPPHSASARRGISRLREGGWSLMSAYSAPEGSGVAMKALIADLYPICRSITGEGFRESLRELAELVPIIFTEVASGTPVLDWTVPKEWNIRDAWIADQSGRRVVDFRESNLHVMSYSTPIRARM